MSAITIDALITRMEQLCDAEGDSHLGTAEKFSIMNSAIAEAWDIICNSGLGETYVKSQTFNATSGTLEYNLSGTGIVSAGDFYRISHVYVVEPQNHLRPLRRLNWGEIQSFSPPTQTTQMKLYYIPSSPVLTTGQTFEGINGWEELVLMIACCAVKFKKDESYAQFRERRQQLEARVRAMGQIDFAEPIRVSRKRKMGGPNTPYALYTNNLNAYSIRGNKLELYAYTGYVP